VPQSDVSFTSANRAFRYGDAVFETMRLIDGNVCFAQRHLERLIAGVQLLHLRLPAAFISQSLEEWCRKLAETETIKSGRLRLTVFRSDGGNYRPMTNDASWLLELEALSEKKYAFNERGLTVELYQDVRKPLNEMANIKSANALIYVLAGIFAMEHQLDDSILINQHGNVIEATASNLFAVKNGVLYTCPLSEGCVAGIMRREVKELAEANKIAVYEVPLTTDVLLNADEIFLTNAIRGIQWVEKYRQKKYTHQTGKRLHELLVQLIYEK
jgi:branched-chain amino acid aminotransferase